MTTPSAIAPSQVNALSQRREQLERQISIELSRIATIDATMRGVELAADITSKQLDIVSGLLKTPLAGRDFTAVPQMIQEKTKKIRDDSIGNYRDLLKARDNIMVEGRVIQMTPELRAEHLASYTRMLDEKLAVTQLQIDASTPLEELQQRLQSQFVIQRDLYQQMLDNKSGRTAEFLESKAMSDLNETQKEKKELLSAAPRDIWSASEQGNLEFLQKAVQGLSFFQRKSTFFNRLNSEGWAPVHLACFYSHLHIVTFLAQNDADISFKDKEGYHPIHWAAKVGSVPIVDFLLQNRVGINVRGSYERTPLHMSVFNKRKELTAFLIAKGADVNAQASVADGSKTPLHEAVLHCDVENVILLVRSPQLNVNIVDSHGCTPLNHAVYQGHVEIATLIVSHQSWRAPQDPKDQNYIAKLREIVPIKCQEEMRKFLQGLH